MTSEEHDIKQKQLHRVRPPTEPSSTRAASSNYVHNSAVLTTLQWWQEVQKLKSINQQD